MLAWNDSSVRAADEIARLRALWCEEKSKAMTFYAEVERLRAERDALKADANLVSLNAVIATLRADLAQRTAERDALAAEVAALKAEVSRISLRWEIADHRVSLLWAERDEARREVCRLIAFGFDGPKGAARQRGWDCFDAKEVKP
jgi:cell division protein FtsB